MSYEGYSQLLCKKGHTWNVDCNDMPNLQYEEPRDMKCPICKGIAIWENMVDVTNGSWDDDGNRIDGYIKLKIKSETSGKCSACGEKHICERTYEIPEKVAKSVRLCPGEREMNNHNQQRSNILNVIICNNSFVDTLRGLDTLSVGDEE